MQFFDNFFDKCLAVRVLRDCSLLKTASFQFVAYLTMDFNDLRL